MDALVCKPFDEMESATEHLLQHGYTVIPYDDTEARKFQKLFREFCVRKTHKELQEWCLEVEKRPDGKREPDDGYSWKPLEEGKDVKHVFHYRHSLWDLLKYNGVLLDHDNVESKLDYEFMAQAAKVFHEHERHAFLLADSLDQYGSFPFSWYEKLESVKLRPVATARPVLRGLYYPERRETVMAKDHFDRDCITFHACDEGGNFYIKYPDGRRMNCSPKPGEMLVMWGWKAHLEAERHGFQIEAAAHGSDALPGVERQAVVSFWHTNTVLWDAPKIDF